VKATFIRSAEFELRDDGRTLTGRIVPYEEVADIAELDESGELVRYQEQFLKHSLLGMAQGFQARGGRFVPLLIDHNDAFDNMIGHAVEIRSEDDGAYAAFRLYDDERITKIRSVLKESHSGLSISFRDTRQPKLVDGIISRVQVHVNHVAATPMPAYANATIENIRDSGAALIEDHRPNLENVKAWLQEQRQMIGGNHER
jgi:HK97 family phage prohead protease